MKTKTIAMIMAMTMILVSLISGTLAWLIDSSENVENTFTTANINIELIETLKPDGTEVTAGVTDWTAAMIPGYTYSKNPEVTVKANSVDCYLFVKFEVTGTTTGLEYTSTLETDSEWTRGTGTDGNGVPTNVWFRKVASSDSDQSWGLLKDNQVKISGDLTKDNMPTTAPKFTYTAYACQLHDNNDATDNEFTPAEAWSKIGK